MTQFTTTNPLIYSPYANVLIPLSHLSGAIPVSYRVYVEYGTKHQLIELHKYSKLMDIRSLIIIINPGKLSLSLKIPTLANLLEILENFDSHLESVKTFCGPDVTVESIVEFENSNGIIEMPLAVFASKYLSIQGGKSMYRLVPIQRELVKLIPRDDFDYTGLNPEKLKKKIMKQFKKDMEAQYTKYLPRSSNLPDNFQHPNAVSIVIYDKDSNEILRHKGKIKKKVLNRICSKYPKAKVIVDLGNGLGKTISLKTFKRLCKIKFIIVETTYDFCKHDKDNGVECLPWWTPSTKTVERAYSISQLLRIFILGESHQESSKNLLSVGSYGFIPSDRVCKIMYTTGSVTTVEYDEFLKFYGLDMEMRPLDLKRKGY